MTHLDRWDARDDRMEHPGGETADHVLVGHRPLIPVPPSPHLVLGGRQEIDEDGLRAGPLVEQAQSDVAHPGQVTGACAVEIATHHRVGDRTVPRRHG